MQFFNLTYFHNVLFPILGDFFGKLTAVATANWYDAWCYVLNIDTLWSQSILVTNLYTGAVYNLGNNTNIFWGVITLPLQIIFEAVIVPLRVYLPINAPFWLSVIVLVFFVGLAFTIVGWFKNKIF